MCAKETIKKDFHQRHQRQLNDDSITKRSLIIFTSNSELIKRIVRQFSEKLKEENAHNIFSKSIMRKCLEKIKSPEILKFSFLCLISFSNKEGGTLWAQVRCNYVASLNGVVVWFDDLK